MSEDRRTILNMLSQGKITPEEAERLLVDTGWLPEPLRLVAEADASAPEIQTDGEDEGAALPDFLAGDDEENAGEDDERHLVAAE